MNYFLILFSICLIVIPYVLAEMDHYRRGHDTYEWTKKLIEWVDK